MSTLRVLTPEIGEQLRMALALDEVEDAAREEHISPEEAQMISNSARDALEGGSANSAAWLSDYGELREAGWPWRVAAFIAWSASPRTARWPETQRALAQDVLGLRSDRVLRTWREKNAGIDAAVGLLQAKALFEHRRDILQALIDSATTADHKNHPDRKLALEMLGDYTPKMETALALKAADDLSEMSEDELARAAARLQGGGSRVEGGG